MRPWVAVAVATAAVIVLVPVVPAQSLAEVAARTKKKEEAKGKQAAPKVYTESDLRGRPNASGSMSAMEGPGATTVTPAAGASPTPVAAVDGTKPKTEEELRSEREADWRARLQKMNEEIARVSDEVNRAQTALNDIQGPLYGGTRAALITRVEEGQRQLAAARQQLADLQEEGRRARFRE